LVISYISFGPFLFSLKPANSVSKKETTKKNHTCATEMARLLLPIFAFCAVVIAVTGSTFDESNLIRLVSDLDSHMLDVIGQSRNALSFLRFARRYGKNYQSNDEIRHRFQIFSDNIRRIRSSNKRPLTYTLGVNSMCLLNDSLFHFLLFPPFVT